MVVMDPALVRAPALALPMSDVRLSMMMQICDYAIAAALIAFFYFIFFVYWIGCSRLWYGILFTLPIGKLEMFVDIVWRLASIF